VVGFLLGLELEQDSEFCWLQRPQRDAPGCRDKAADVKNKVVESAASATGKIRRSVHEHAIHRHPGLILSLNGMGLYLSGVSRVKPEL